MNTYIVAKKEERIYAKTSFSSFRLQPVEYSGTSSNGFYQINSLTFTDKDNYNLNHLKVSLKLYSC